MSQTATAARARRGGRIESIDFWRGLVLIVIFINHMPGNIFGRITPSNFGFSDSAEAFVFIAGLSVALAWGGLAAHRALGPLMERALQRAVVLYAVHLLLTFTAIALYANAFVLAGDERFLLHDGRDIVFEAPGSAMTGIVLLGHQLAFYNILPLYVVLIGLSPLFLLAAWRSPLTTLMISVMMYVAAQLTPVNLPGWPGGDDVWFFNPFAWQLAFTSGIVVGVLRRRDGLAIPSSNLLLAASALYVAFAAVVTSNAFGLAPGLFASVYQFGTLDKSSMSVMRFVHFLALAYLLSQLRIGERLMRFDWGQATALIGRHSLAVFALGSVLSSIGLICRMLADGTRLESDILAGVVLVPAGVMGMYWLARYLGGRRVPVHGAARPRAAVA